MAHRVSAGARRRARVVFASCGFRWAKTGAGLDFAAGWCFDRDEEPPEEAMNFAEIIYDKSDRIATITFNRPEKMNAWTPTMGAETRTALLEAERDPRVGAIIITGAGRAYCAGADMGGLSEISSGRASTGGGPGLVPGQEEWLGQQRPDYRNQYAYVL